MLPVETFLWGFLGSAAVELVHLVGFYTSQRGRLPARYRKAGFWITRCVLALVAGAVAVAYDIHQPILAINIGAATPLIIGLMAKGLRQVSVNHDPRGSLPSLEDRSAPRTKPEDHGSATMPGGKAHLR